MRTYVRRLTVCLVTVAALMGGVAFTPAVLAAPATPSPTAHRIPAAHGGGCRYGYASQFAANACISASGLTLLPDGYMVGIGPDCKYIIVVLNGPNRGATTNSCHLGHVVGPALSGWFGQTFTCTIEVLDTYNQLTVIATSPPVTL